MRLLRSLLNFCTAVVLAVGYVGCASEKDDGRPRRTPVIGEVTLNGTPLAEATVTFHPIGHSYAAVGLTDKKGKFALTTLDGNDGAIPGMFGVTISKYDFTHTASVENGDGTITEFPPQVLVPEKYATVKTSELTATVDAEKKNQFQFNLSGDLPPRPTGQRVGRSTE